MKKNVPNLTVVHEEEKVKSPRQDPPPTSTVQPEPIINPEELKEEPVEFDISSMNFPKIFVTKEDELADFLRPKKSKTGSKAKHMPGNIKKKGGNPKRHDPVGPVQVKSPSREVVVPPVPEIVKVPKSTYAYAFHISEQPPIELFLNELLSVKSLTRTNKLPERLEFHYSSQSRITWPLERILDQDYNDLKTVYLKLDTRTSYSQGVKSEILKRIEDIRKKWNEPSDLPLRLSLPDTD